MSKPELSRLTDGEFFDCVFDATGNSDAMNAGFDYVAHGGAYVLVSIVRDTISFSDPEFHKRETTLLSSRNATRQDFDEVFAALRAGRIPTAALNTHRASLERGAGAVFPSGSSRRPASSKRSSRFRRPMSFPILQFGTSRFLQAHADLFVSEALARGEAAGKIAVVQTTSSPDSRRRLAFFNEGRPYTRPCARPGRRRRSIDEWIEVSSIGRGIDANLEWDAVENLFVNEARWVISNTGDRGYELDAADRPDGPVPTLLPRQADQAAARALSRRARAADACCRANSSSATATS